MPVVILPARCRDRETAESLLSRLLPDLSDSVLDIRCESANSVGPGFVDALLLEVFRRRSARKLVVHQPPPQLDFWMRCSAAALGVSDRLVIR